MPLGVLTFQIQIPGCASLKEKRSRLKPLLARLRRAFNISIAEMGHNDAWGRAVITCALVSNDNGHTQRALQAIPVWIEKNWPDVIIISEQIEII